jgi:hypothetical protein
VRSRILFGLLLVAGLALPGAVAGRIAAPTWSRMRAQQPGPRLDSAMAAGQGLTLALLGGFRALAADALWLKLHFSWERHDLAAADALVRLVPTTDPRPEYFWLNGARIMAYDFPVWRIRAAGGFETVATSTQQQIMREQGVAAIAWLERGMAFHPHNAEFWIERANVELNGLHDVAAAAQSYRQAWAQPHAPYYAARLYAEMLRRTGRDADALAWLVQLHPTLPRDDASAAADTVLARIRALEQKLGVPPGSAYRVPTGG